MNGPFEYCPTCRGTRGTTVTLGLISRRDGDGGAVDALLYHLHCASCNTYLLSYPYIEEDSEAEAVDIPHFLGVRH